jgi:hypothetical protein
LIVGTWFRALATGTADRVDPHRKEGLGPLIIGALFEKYFCSVTEFRKLLDRFPGDEKIVNVSSEGLKERHQVTGA